MIFKRSPLTLENQNHRSMRIVAILLSVVALTAFSAPKKGVLKLPKLFKKTFSYVPEGNVKTAFGSVTVGDFYMSRTEVSNVEYREFLYHIEKNKPELLETVQIDSLRWAEVGMEPFITHYHRHPAYGEYPVVNISHEAAMLYCAWLTEFNREVGLFAGEEGYQVTYRLPNHEEWMFAAQGGKGEVPYAWGTINNNDASVRLLGNFSTDYLSDVDGLTITTPVKSYAPNPFGLYNLNGNVAEMLSMPGIAAGGAWNSNVEEAKNTSVMSYKESSPFVGFRVIAEVKHF